jgi:uncharacterized membrane protein
MVVIMAMVVMMVVVMIVVIMVMVVVMPVMVMVPAFHRGPAVAATANRTHHTTSNSRMVMSAHPSPAIDRTRTRAAS